MWSRSQSVGCHHTSTLDRKEGLAFGISGTKCMSSAMASSSVTMVNLSIAPCYSAM